MNVSNRGRMGQAQNVREVLEVFMMLRKPLASHGPFVEPKPLNLRTHVASKLMLVENQLSWAAGDA
jgi:hypothetical protein